VLDGEARSQLAVIMAGLVPAIHVLVRHSGAVQQRRLGCAIAHLRISRFRVWSFATIPE
jgi:hypothetical protein